MGGENQKTATDIGVKGEDEGECDDGEEEGDLSEEEEDIERLVRIMEGAHNFAEEQRKQLVSVGEVGGEEFGSKDWGSVRGEEKKEIVVGVKTQRGVGGVVNGGESGSVFGRSSRHLVDGGSVGKRGTIGNNTAINIRTRSKRSIGGKGIQTVRN